MRLSPSPSASHNHRPSFTEQLRGAPPSPRQQRHLSLSQSQVLDLLNNPPTAGQADPKFAGRDWQHIVVGELVATEDVHFVEFDTGIEEATNVDTPSLATNRPWPKIPLREAKSLGSQEAFVTLPHTAQLTSAVELFGGGVHRIVIVKEGSGEVVGILSQLRLVKFLWENGGSFPVLERLYGQEISQLGIGSQNLISINGDTPLKEALKLMNNEGVSSLAIVDNQYNVVGNISNVDVKSFFRLVE
ncbi:uncharacterized protein KY384_005845 [Bacidia gigantensis]|uniref:uncharacterized protein n=1 Tax=Bacidia gigantensis TaxID=2732470 RepID=UPI001D04CF4E|nr:uncharacterized protein KY384_005845 [Bacidia gigantensis]KAG8529210.1 hypothetical protein KY384_005845 [Bacidia gigantensis]